MWQDAVVAGSIRQRGKESWELRVHVGRDPDTGRKQYMTRTVKGTRKQAERELARLVVQVEDGQFTAKGGTISDLCERWFEQAEPDLSPPVAENYRRLLDRHILPRFGSTPLRKLRTSELDAWYAQLRKKGGAGGKPLTPNSVMRIHAVLRRALAQGVRWGWLATNPAANATPPRGRKHEIVPPKPADVVRLVEAAAKVNAGLAVFLRLAAVTGARRGELCALQWKHVDFDQRQVTIGRSIVTLASGELIQKDTKTHATRRIGLDAHTVELLADHRERCRELAATVGVTLGEAAYIFSHELDGTQPWRPNYATLAFGRLAKELGLAGVRLHDLRHFAATLMLVGGQDVRTVSGRLGHANAATTLGVYAHFLDAADHKAAELMGSLLDGDTPRGGVESQSTADASADPF